MNTDSIRRILSRTFILPRQENVAVQRWRVLHDNRERHCTVDHASSSSSSTMSIRSSNYTTSTSNNYHHHHDPTTRNHNYTLRNTSTPHPCVLPSSNLKHGKSLFSCRNFSSSAAAAVDEVTSSSKRPMRRSGPGDKKDPIILTERAAERIKELLASPNGRNALGIRLGVKRRGCNGLSYTLNYATERQPHEEEMTAHGVTVFIEPMALFNVVGTVMDYEITDMSSEFTFQNPNSKGQCGCGESFNV